MPRYMIQSSTDGGVVWSTRDACENERQYTSSIDALELFDDCAARYRVFDLETQAVIFDTHQKTERA